MRTLEVEWLSMILGQLLERMAISFLGRREDIRNRRRMKDYVGLLDPARRRSCAPCKACLMPVQYFSCLSSALMLSVSSTSRERANSFKVFSILAIYKKGNIYKRMVFQKKNGSFGMPSNNLLSLPSESLSRRAKESAFSISSCVL